MQPPPLAWSGSDTAITGNLWRGFGMSEVAKFREETNNTEHGRDSWKKQRHIKNSQNSS